MKKIKSLLFVLLTFTLFFTMMVNVSADNKGKIIVNGTIEGKTYEIYKIFDLTYQGTKVAYTINPIWNSFFEGDGSKYITDTNFSNLNAITIGSKTRYINITSENIEEFTQDALKYAASLEDVDVKIVADGNSVTFDNLDLGYYLVYPQSATDILEGYGSICSITSTMPNGEVNIKASEPTIEKTVDDANAFVGQLVKFTITGLVPDTTGYKSYTYQISDTMTNGLALDCEVAEFSIKFGDTEIDATPVCDGNGFTLTFDMTKQQEHVGKIISVTYKVRVTEEAVNSSTTKNSATLTYSRNPKTDETAKTPPVEVMVYSSLINVIKVDARNETQKLAGASFVVKNMDGLYYKAVDDNNNLITNTYKTDNVFKVEWVESLDDATLLVTEDDGIITFEGVENGTYYLVEVEAPEGYNKLTGPVTLKVGYSNEEGTNLSKNAVSHIETVKNNSGTALPETGGMGTTLFIIIGSLLTIVPIMFLIVNKRMSKEY